MIPDARKLQAELNKKLGKAPEDNPHLFLCTIIKCLETLDNGLQGVSGDNDPFMDYIMRSVQSLKVLCMNVLFLSVSDSVQKTIIGKANAETSEEAQKELEKIINSLGLDVKSPPGAYKQEDNGESTKKE